MALSTTSNPSPPTQQAPTRGVSGTPGSRQPGGPPPQMAPSPGISPYPPRQGGVQPSTVGPFQSEETAGAEPILFEDIEPGLLGRVHPQSSVANSEAGQQALEAGNKVREDGMHLRANVDEEQPQPESGTSAPPTDQPSSGRPQTAPSRPDEPALHTQQTAAGVAFPPQQHAGDTPPYVQQGGQQHGWQENPPQQQPYPPPQGQANPYPPQQPQYPPQANPYPPQQPQYPPQANPYPPQAS